MQDTETILSGIEFKIRNLLNLQNKLKADNKELKIENGELRKNIEIQSNKLKELEEKNRILRISKTLDTSKDSKDLRLKINEIVREVDKCVSLLSK
jgi:hypothetical protein